MQKVICVWEGIFCMVWKNSFSKSCLYISQVPGNEPRARLLLYCPFSEHATNLLKCYIRIKIDRIYKFDIILLPQNINRFSGSTPRVLIVVFPDKSPGVILLDSGTRSDKINNSQKTFNGIKKVLPEC